jgi:protein phosphatase
MCIMTGMSQIVVPAGSLVVLIGVSGAGKSTFAARWFRPTQVLSSDTFRAIVADDPADQSASQAAFELLHLAARRRLERGRLTVIDATNVTRQARAELVSIAQATRRPAVAIVLDPPLAIAHGRNALRPGRTVEQEVVERQASALRRSLARTEGLAAEGFVAVHRLDDPADIGGVSVDRGARRPGRGAQATGTGTIPATPVRRRHDRSAAR